MTQSCQIKQRYHHIHFTCILCILNNTCVQQNFKSVHVRNLFWNREYNSAKGICKYASFSKLNIQSDLFWHRCLEMQTFGTPRMYTLSLSKSIKRSNYREFLKVKNVLFMYTMYYRQQRTSTLRIWKVCVKISIEPDIQELFRF
jgi:hypothetical protein